jgi:hypothetical protein
MYIHIYMFIYIMHTLIYAYTHSSIHTYQFIYISNYTFIYIQTYLISLSHKPRFACTPPLVQEFFISLMQHQHKPMKSNNDIYHDSNKNERMIMEHRFVVIYRPLFLASSIFFRTYAFSASPY